VGLTPLSWRESRHNGLLWPEAAANLNDVPNVRQQGSRLGNWLTKEQARELAVSQYGKFLDRSSVVYSLAVQKAPSRTSGHSSARSCATRDGPTDSPPLYIFGRVELKHWKTEEYVAGYRARFSDIPDYEKAHHCWRCGWENADTEALESKRHRRVVAAGREDHFEGTRGNLFDSGKAARANGISFDEDPTEPWKEGWVAVDIELGMLPQ